LPENVIIFASILEYGEEIKRQNDDY